MRNLSEFLSDFVNLYYFVQHLFKVRSGCLRGYDWLLVLFLLKQNESEIKQIRTNTIISRRSKQETNR